MALESPTPAAALVRALLEFRQLASRHHAPGELGRTEFSILLSLDQGSPEGVRVSDLARRLECSPPTMTQSTGSLHRLGYVQRRPDPGDRRVIRIALTDAGREAVQERKRRFQDYCERLAVHLGEADSLKLAELLGKTARFMQADPIQPQKEQRS